MSTSVLIYFLYPPLFVESPAHDPDDDDDDDDGSYDNDDDEEAHSSGLIQTYMSTSQIIDGASNGIGVLDDGQFENVVVGETTVVENVGQRPTNDDDEKTFKKPAQPHTKKERKSANSSDKHRNVISKPTREIVSCFMTTSGFISPAREGKLPEARRPIVIPTDVEEPPPPEEIEIKVESPVPEPVIVVDKKQKRDRRDMENDERSNVRHNDRSYNNDDNEKDVKLYEVIQTAPLEKSSPKKKTKKMQLAMAQPKETKKQKRLKQLNAAKGKKMNDASNIHVIDTFNPYEDRNTAFDSHPPPLTEKQKKKLQKMESLKKKNRKERQMLIAPYPPNENPELQEKQRKKKMAKMAKKNSAAMGLNSNALDSFAMPSAGGSGLFATSDAIRLEATNSKESQKKNKQLDKQKMKFFKKLQSTSTMLSRPSDDLDRSMSPPPATDFNSADRAPTNVDDYNWSTVIDDPLPGKKSKQQKKSKPPKEAKEGKVKKPKEGKSPSKKPRAPKLPKIPEESLPVTPKLEKSPLRPLSPASSHLPKLPPPFMLDMDIMSRFPGPGLIPSNPLFQSFQFDVSSSSQMPNYPFPGLSGFDFANLARFKRPNFDDLPTDTRPSTDRTMDPSISGAKRLCNVASLMPPSLASEIDNVHTKPTFSDVDEIHVSRKHTEIHTSTTSTPFNSKKSSTVTTTSTFEKRESFASPIVVDDEDDFNGEHSRSQSPPHGNPHIDPAGHVEEVKRKKNKDKSSKEGKKDKKDKELKDGIKIKKKKDKKDKIKNKTEHGEQLKSPKDKAQLKKEKREKKKEKERAAMAMDSGGLADHTEWSRDAFERDTSSMDFNADTSSMEASAIPKLTLKLGPLSSSPSSRTSRPFTPDFPVQQRKS